MADYTAIYEAGNALVEYLRDVLTPEPISKKELISLMTPYEPENSQLTVYMYSIEEDPGIAVPGGYEPTGYDTAGVPATPLQAGFLITAHSNAPAQQREADRLRILGAAIQALKDMPVMDKRYLSGSLARAGVPINVNIDHVSHENILKIWNNNSVPYKTSVVVRLNGIEIDSKRKQKISRVTDVQIGVGHREAADGR